MQSQTILQETFKIVIFGGMIRGYDSGYDSGVWFAQVEHPALTKKGARQKKTQPYEKHVGKTWETYGINLTKPGKKNWENSRHRKTKEKTHWNIWCIHKIQQENFCKNGENIGTPRKMNHLRDGCSHSLNSFNVTEDLNWKWPQTGPFEIGKF